MTKLVVLDAEGVLHGGSTPPSSTILEEFAKKLAENQVDLDPEFAQVIEEEFWTLL